MFLCKHPLNKNSKKHDNEDKTINTQIFKQKGIQYNTYCNIN